MVFRPYIQSLSLFFLLAVGSYYLLLKVWELITAFSRQKDFQCTVLVSCKGRTLKLQALIDSGNSLRDAQSGKPVHIVGRQAIRGLWKDEPVTGLRYVSYHSVGRENGVMPLLELDRMKILRRRGNETETITIDRPLVAVCEEEKVTEQYDISFKSRYLNGRTENLMIKVAVPHRFKLKVVPDFRTFFFPDRREIHYIGGADILPAPLDLEEEAKAIADLGSERDEQARKLLIEHNLRLVVYIAKKFDNTGVGVEDLISIGTIGLMKAINTFDAGKSIKLATYASRCIENEILMYLRKNSKQKMEVSIDEPLNVDWDGNELLLSDILGTDDDVISRRLEDEVEIALLGKAISKLTKREQMIIRLRFGIGNREGSEKTQKEVADLLGISQSYISRLEKRIMKRLRKEIVKYE